jgi:hypothetical protein
VVKDIILSVIVRPAVLFGDIAVARRPRGPAQQITVATWMSVAGSVQSLGWLGLVQAACHGNE